MDSGGIYITACGDLGIALYSMDQIVVCDGNSAADCFFNVYRMNAYLGIWENYKS